MNFENPVWLMVTPLIVTSIAGLIAFGLRRRDALLSQFAAARLLDQLTEKASLRLTLIKIGLILLAVALIGISLARPQYGVEFVKREARGLDIVFVLDSSRSMLATDLRPNRLERAKLSIIDLVEQLESDRIGLVVFAGNAFLQTPPTLDYSAFRENLNSVGPSSISRGGSNIGQALREAVKAFPKDDNFKVVVLLTDGEDLEEQSIDTARTVAKDGIKVYSIGIGTPEGTYLKARAENGTEEFIRDSDGQPVRSRLDEATLQKISQLTGGSYSRLAGQSLKTLYSSVLSTLPRDERKSELQETRIERYQWVLLAAIVCLVLETLVRRRQRSAAQLIIAVLAILNLLAPTPVLANETTKEPFDETAEEVTAENSSTDPRVVYNQAHSSLLEGDYVKARDLYEQAIKHSDDIELERDGLYNMAHIMNQMGEKALQTQDFESAAECWKQAEQLFKSTNELDPADTESLEDAQLMATRRKALEEFMNQQKPQEQPQSNDSDQSQTDSETESDGNEKDDSMSSSNNTSNQSEDSQSNENGSDSESPSSENGQNSKSDQGQDNKEAPVEDFNDEDSNGNSSSESTRNPADDIQQKDENAASGNENGNNESLQETADGTNDAMGAQGPSDALEGMNISEAQLLLDSLRDDEQLLPFTEPSDENQSSGRKGEIRDW